MSLVALQAQVLSTAFLCWLLVSSGYKRAKPSCLRSYVVPMTQVANPAAAYQWMLTLKSAGS
jgi:hypothetical protein